MIRTLQAALAETVQGIFCQNVSESQEGRFLISCLGDMSDPEDHWHINTPISFRTSCIAHTNAVGII
jgi:hypothetical protein